MTESLSPEALAELKQCPDGGKPWDATDFDGGSSGLEIAPFRPEWANWMAKVLNAVPALITSIEEAGKEIVALGKLATEQEVDKEYNAELVKERDAQIEKYRAALKEISATRHATLHCKLKEIADTALKGE